MIQGFEEIARAGSHTDGSPLDLLDFAHGGDPETNGNRNCHILEGPGISHWMTTSLPGNPHNRPQMGVPGMLPSRPASSCSAIPASSRDLLPCTNIASCAKRCRRCAASHIHLIGRRALHAYQPAWGPVAPSLLCSVNANRLGTVGAPSARTT
jgi:hypothetical protein